MSQQLLDRAQVGAALQQVRGERVAQRVRRDRRPARGLEPAAGAARPRWTAAGRSSRGTARLAVAGCSSAGPAARQVAVERPPGVLADRHHARPAALALHAHLLGVGIEARQRRGPRAPRPAARPRRPARAGRGRAGRAAWSAGMRSSSSATSSGFSTLRQVGVLLGARHQVGRVRLQLAALDEVAVEGADRGQLARDGRLRPRRARRARRRSGAAPGGSGRAGASSRAAAHSASWARSTP